MSQQPEPPAPSRLRRLLRLAVVDVSPLRESVDYRWLYGGHLVNELGRQLTVVAVPYQVFLLTRSSLAVGLIGLAQLGPLVICSIFGGAVVDAVDRRRLLIVVQLLMALTSAGLAINAAARQPAVWPLFVLSAANAGLSGLDSPARTAVLPTLVSRSNLAGAFALNQTLQQTAATVGPAVAGLIIARVSLPAAYWLDAASFTISTLALVPIRPLRPQGETQRAGFSSVVTGLRFLRSRRLLQGTFVIDLNAMIFGMPRALFPALGTQVFGGGAAVVGLLYAAPGAGALLGALTTGWVSTVRRQGRAVLIAVAVWGAAITAFGLVDALPVALALLAVGGAADVVSAVFRTTILQMTTPDSLRGRMSAVHIAVVAGGPRLGDAEAGAVAAISDARTSVIVGGVACLLGTLAIARGYPELARYTDEPAA